MTEDRYCPITGHQIGRDRYASPAAAGRLRATLTGLPDLMTELEVTITRQVRMTGASGTDDVRLPFNVEASERAWVLRQTMLVWVDTLARVKRETCPACDGEGSVRDDDDDHGDDDDAPICERCEGRGTVGVATPDTWTSIAEHLTAWADWMTTTHDGATAIEEILDATTQAMRAIDRPAQRTYAGPCPGCGCDVYGRPGTDTARCTGCGAELSRETQREDMLEKLLHIPLNAADAARALTSYGHTVTPALIRKWKERGIITPAGTRNQQPTYTIAAILDVLSDRMVS